MATAFDAAAYILEKKGTLTGYQLQKLLYYSQVWHLVATGEPLFPERIVAYRHGPVVPDVSICHQHKRWVHSEDIQGNTGNVGPRAACVIDAVLSSYGDMSGEELEELSHSEEQWREYFNNQAGHESEEIPLESLANYYAGLWASDVRTRQKHHVPKLPDGSRRYVSVEDYDWLSDMLEE